MPKLIKLKVKINDLLLHLTSYNTEFILSKKQKNDRIVSVFRVMSLYVPKLEAAANTSDQITEECQFLRNSMSENPNFVQKFCKAAVDRGKIFGHKIQDLS